MNSAGPWRELQAMASAGERKKSLAKKEEEEKDLLINSPKLYLKQIV